MKKPFQPIGRGLSDRFHADECARYLKALASPERLRIVAQLLGIKPGSVAAAVARYHLPRIGRGKAYRLPRATIEVLLERLPDGASIATANQYLTHLKSFCHRLRNRLPGQQPGQPDTREFRLDR
jgi:hypothetical protein